ncbi:MAG TPA: CsbD family protein [Acidimicrobiales bacterium]|nr:CsbD family protein [Acidimicrobiales bacterium]
MIPSFGDKVVGLTREFWGTVLDRDDLRTQGQAQQKKADERMEEFRREVKADAKRMEAAAKEKRQQANQGKSPGESATRKMTGMSGPEAGARGAVEKVKGGLKEAAGSVVGNDRMRAEGSAQQEKASAQSDVAKEEAKAEEARTKANAAERQQRAAGG